MKRSILLIVALSLVFLAGCGSTPPSPALELPRREFIPVEIDDETLKEPFVVNEFVSDGRSFRKESIYFATALLLSDIAVREETPKELFEKYASTIFSEFPDQGDFKEIVIPNLSKSEEDDIQKDAYFFITKQKDKLGEIHYLIESNISIESYYGKTYDGYVTRMDTGFYRDKIPARWTSIMRVMVNEDILVYRGVAYPSKSAPLIFTGTGIGSDVYMNTMLPGKPPIAETKDKLQEIVENALKNTKPEDQEHLDSLKFLEKDANLSFSAYSYLDAKFEDAKEYYRLAQEIIIDLPNNVMGSRYKELERIMYYLLYIIGE